MDDEVVVGVLGSARGLHGEIFAYSHTDSPEKRFAVGTTLIARSDERSDGQDDVALTVESTRQSHRQKQSQRHTPGLFIRFQQLRSKEDADQLRGYRLYAKVDNSESDAFYSHQLKGLQVIDLCGEPLGTVIDVHYGPAQDLLVVRPQHGQSDENVLVPFVQQIVPTVDLKKEHVVVDPPQGLFPGTDMPQQQEAQ